MEIQTLSGLQAFSPGSDLWVVPQEAEFSLFDRLDWYLNLLLSKSLAHQVQEPSLQILDLLKKTDQHFVRQSLPSPAAHLFVVPHLVPAKYLVHLPYTGSLATWAKAIDLQAQQLRATTLRIFLPRSANELLLPSHFQKPEDAATPSVSVVPPGASL